ncbi:MAG: dihydroorotase [Candidatus Gracilibacteria bacterium]|nr:dihydroorotase [Candidatus Gracilibacteria bacterium]MDD5178710.1 dihydroorotase [Candidatus Gracilibacteria bacterium]
MLLIKNGILVNTGSKNPLQQVDILVSGKKIVKIGKNLTATKAQLINAKGRIITAGLIDLHTHLRDPGFTSKETIASGSAAAALGGFTTIVAMPNTQPRMDTAEKIKSFLARAKSEGVVNILTTGNLTQNGEGKLLTNFAALKKAGVKILTDDGCGDSHPQDLEVEKKLIAAAKKVKLPVMMHAEDSEMKCNTHLHAGVVAKKLGIRGSSAECETVMIERVLELLRKNPTPYHFTHLSAAGSVDLIRVAKKRGLPITADTTPHHLTLTEKAILDSGTLAKVNPPLRSEAHRKALIAGVKSGVIDAIATDHAPHLAEEKNCEFTKAAVGLVGLETAFAVLYTDLVKRKLLTLPQLIEKLTTAPAKILKLKAGEIKVGKEADITIWDIETAYKIDKTKFASKGRNTPWNGKKVFGKATDVIVGGKIVVKAGKLVGDNS